MFVQSTINISINNHLKVERLIVSRQEFVKTLSLCLNNLDNTVLLYNTPSLKHFQQCYSEIL